MTPYSTNGHMAIIYQIKHKKTGLIYVGATVCDLKTRIVEHKSVSKKSEKPLYKLIQRDGIESFSWKVVSQCSNESMWQEESLLIEKYKKKGLSLNISMGGRGPSGCKMTAYNKSLAAKEMKKRWSKDRQGMLQRVNAHKDFKFQSTNGKLGAKAKWAKEPEFKVYCNLTKKLIGKFKTRKEFAKKIGVEPCTAARYFSGKLKKGHKLYKFVVLGG